MNRNSAKSASSAKGRLSARQIEKRVAEGAGIASLNPMQRLMLASKAPSVVLISPTGSGKTLAFAVRLLAELRPADGRVQAVVIAPSRELVLQTASVIRSVAGGWKTVACYGGHPMREEAASLAVDTSVIVATPGRLLDHLQRGTLTECRPRVLVLDEYDKSLELGFADEMKRICKRLGNVPVTLLTSATVLAEMPDYLRLHDTETIDMRPATESPARRIDVVEVESPARDKLQTLIDLLRSLEGGKAIVFVNHRESVERVYEALRKASLPATLYHGAMDQEQRVTAVDLLENGTAPIMVATDLAARGLDVAQLNHIVHYHMPVSAEAWTHRNGRTARQDASGTVYVIRSEADDVPEYIAFDRQYAPTGVSATPIEARMATVRFDAGRKEKISRGDIAGFLMKQAGLDRDDVGVIALHDHYALAAVSRSRLADVLAAEPRLKGKKVRVQQLRYACAATGRR